VKGDLVKLLQKHITKSIDQINKQAKNGERDIARLSKKLNRVVRKSAGRDSLFNAVLEKQIKTAKSELEELGRLLEISTRALEILTDHEDTTPEVVKPPPEPSPFDAPYPGHFTSNRSGFFY
jgi:superfamily II RNA helicase